MYKNLTLFFLIFFTSCSKNDSISDSISSVNPYITIGSQKWMKVNLDVETYRNGDKIPQVTDKAAWSNLTTGAWCYYNNDPSNETKYGKLYNWYAVNDSRGLAPQGWHIPSDDEWKTLSSFLGGDVIAGGKMKEAGNLNWQIPNKQATNESGFLGLPGGVRDGSAMFLSVGNDGAWWSATQDKSNFAWTRFLTYSTGELYRFSNSMNNGFSVRCIKD